MGPPSRSSILARQKTRRPPLQIIPELSESQLDIDVSSTHLPATARPTQSSSQQPELKTSHVTLSAYTFSPDDEPSMSSDEISRSPALSASSSTSDGASSEDVPTTPGISDDEDGHDLMLFTPRVCSQRISIRPHCIIKTRPSTCREDEDIHNYLEKEEEKAMLLPVTEVQPKFSTEAKAATESAEEAEQDFYTPEFEDFISLSPPVASATSFARRDSLTLAAEEEVALHIEDCIFPEDKSDIPSRGSTIKEAYDAGEEESIYSQSSFAYSASASIRRRSSTDSDALRSSTHSVSSFRSSGCSDAPITPPSFPEPSSPDSELKSTHCLRSRWSSSTMDPLAAKPTQTPTLLSPLKSVFGSRARRVLLPPEDVPPEMPLHLSKNKRDFLTTQSPLSTLGKRLRRQGSRLSTSSAGTSSSECDSHEGPPKGSPRGSLLGLKRKSISVSMFLRA